MKQTLQALLIAAFLLALPAIVLSCPLAVGHAIVVRKEVVVAPPVAAVVVTPVYAPVAVFQAVPFFVPAYGAGYVPPPVQVPAPAPVQGQPQLQQDGPQPEIRRLREELEKLKGGKQPQAPGPEQKPASIEGLFVAKCAGCHEAANADKAGAGFVLLQQGKLASLTERQIRKTASLCYKGDMPKGGSLTDPEMAQVMAWIDSLK